MRYMGEKKITYEILAQTIDILQLPLNCVRLSLLYHLWFTLDVTVVFDYHP